MLDDFVCEMPVPGIPTVRVMRPFVFTLTRAPRTPADTPMFLLDTFSRTPGAILMDLRTLNPIVQPLSTTSTILFMCKERCALVEAKPNPAGKHTWSAIRWLLQESHL
ncbi:hypothetical protein NS234_02545 [Microbacterium oxydans]|nr:hypothetical protein NS234_02545 [Microbacterium oxydans]